MILVTGGCGFIGSAFVLRWLAHASEPLLNLDLLTYAGHPGNLASLQGDDRYQFVRGDIGDAELVTRLLAEHQPRAIVHFAAESHVDRSISGPQAFAQTNVLGTLNLLQAALQHWKSLPAEQAQAFRFLQVSTDEVYGTLGPTDPAFRETTPYAPNSPYAASKACSDHLVRAYHHTYGLPVTTSNCSNNYGPYQFPEKLLPLCLLNILQGKPLPLYGNGLQIRDWLHVDDHNRGIARILEAGVTGETYNIGGNNECTNLDTVKLLCRTVDAAFAADPSLGQRFPQSPCSRGQQAASLITFVKDRPGHDTRYAIDAGKLTRELGYTPARSFADGLATTVAWYFAHEPWWRGIQDQSYRH